MSDGTKLTKELATLPGVVGNMGVSIAEAQKLLNRSYLETIATLVQIFGGTLRPDSARFWGDAATAATADVAAKNEPILRALLEDLAPPRYQYTETRIDFRAELFESSQLYASGGFSGGFGGVALSVSGAYGSQSDYRAAARVTSTIHAIPPSKGTLDTLLGRVKEIPLEATGNAPLTKLGGIDKELLDKLTEIRGHLGEDVSKQLPKPADKAPKAAQPLSPKGPK